MRALAALLLLCLVAGFARADEEDTTLVRGFRARGGGGLRVRVRGPGIRLNVRGPAAYGLFPQLAGYRTGGSFAPAPAYGASPLGVSPYGFGAGAGVPFGAGRCGPGGCR